MTISSFFKDTKLGAACGEILLIFLAVVFLQLMQTKDDGRYLIYLFFVIPVPILPACVIFSKLVSVEEWESMGLFKLSDISTEFAWVSLALSIPFWLFMYQYLDKVLRSQYGIKAHPCYCFRALKKENK